jgi:5-methylcytosine-specific restriction endonuclease McrA
MDEVVKNKGGRSKLTEEEKKNLSIRMTFYNPAKRPEVRKKISESQKGKPGRNKGRHWKISEQAMKNRPTNKGKKLPPKREETKKKISESLKGRFSGEKNPMYGKRLEDSPGWKGGKSFEPYTLDWTKSLKISIRERDHYTCKICGEKQGDRAFSIHHIDYDKTNCNPDNLVALCVNCHTKTNYNRDFWKEYFNKLMKIL